MVDLGVNLDHVATLRQARRTYEPDPVWAAVEAELGGADAITVHLREDRRHINDRDVAFLRQSVQTTFNLEMSIVPEIVELALRTKPDQATIVPEKRQEITTEGGIDLSRDGKKIEDIVKRLRERGAVASAFIDPEVKQIDLAKAQGFDAVELHTGSYANAKGAAQERELARLVRASEHVRSHSLRLHAGHGLNYHNVVAVAAIPGMGELNIGHAIVSRAVFVGLREAVAEMKRIMLRASSGKLTE
jgi:pyridoxine 5-phosphate synthase